MITIYTLPHCPFCDNVKVFAEDNSIKFEDKSIEDAKNLKELIDKGGKRQVPFLVDEEHDVTMFESDDIIQYLGNQHAA